MLSALIFLVTWPLLTGSNPTQATLSSYQRANAAFIAGQDPEAIELIIRAAEQSVGCQWVFPNWNSADELTVSCQGPSWVAGDRLTPEEGAARVLLMWGKRRWEETTKTLVAENRLRKNQHPRLFFEELAGRYPQSHSADDAALLLLEDRFCRQWNNYPDGPAFEIRRYETFLETYPFSDQRPRVLSEMARRYSVLAERYRESAPWQSSARADLCQAMAQGLWQELSDRYPNTAEAREARARLAEIPASQRPAIPMPPGVFDRTAAGAD